MGVYDLLYVFQVANRTSAKIMVHLSTGLTMQKFSRAKTLQYRFIIYVLIMISFWQLYEHFKDDICKAWFVSIGCACAVMFTNVTVRLLSSAAFFSSEFDSRLLLVVMLYAQPCYVFAVFMTFGYSYCYRYNVVVYLRGNKKLKG